MNSSFSSFKLPSFSGLPKSLSGFSKLISTEEKPTEIYKITFIEYILDKKKSKNKEIIEFIEYIIEETTRYENDYIKEFENIMKLPPENNDTNIHSRNPINKSLSLNDNNEYKLKYNKETNNLTFITNLKFFLTFIITTIKEIEDYKDDEIFNSYSYFSNFYTTILKYFYEIMCKISARFYRYEKYLYLIYGIQYNKLLYTLLNLFDIKSTITMFNYNKISSIITSNYTQIETQKDNELILYKYKDNQIGLLDEKKLIKIKNIYTYITKYKILKEIFDDISKYALFDNNQTGYLINNNILSIIDEVKNLNDWRRINPIKKPLLSQNINIDVFTIIYSEYKQPATIIELIDYLITLEDNCFFKFRNEIDNYKSDSSYSLQNLEKLISKIGYFKLDIIPFLIYVKNDANIENKKKEYIIVLELLKKVLLNFNILFYHYNYFNYLIISLEYYAILDKIINWFKTDKLEQYRKIISFNEDKIVKLNLKNIEDLYGIDLLINMEKYKYGRYYDYNNINNLINNLTYNLVVNYILKYLYPDKKKITGGANKYKKTENKITVIYKKKQYTRVIYICERKKYIKINKIFMLLSKLKKI